MVSNGGAPMSNAVELVHRQLECLKYIGGRKDSHEKVRLPSGQGVEVGIVVLPDILIDVREFNLKKGKGMFVVGGRAARMACALLHLLGRDDGTFQVYLLTKTGSLGRLLLKNEFCRESPLWPFPAPFLEYVLSRKGEPRCAIRKKPNMPVRSSFKSEENELSRQDLEIPEVLKLIHKVRTICLTSINTPGFNMLFDLLLSNVKSGEQGFFLDSRRSQGTFLGELMTLIRGLNPEELSKITGIFLREDEEEDFRTAAGRESIEWACRELKIPVIEYGTRTRFLWPDPSVGTITVDGCKQYAREGVAEYFKAGILLAWSLYQTVSSLESSHGTPRSCLMNEWPKSKIGCWKTILEYGAALAGARAGVADGDSSFKSLFHDTLPEKSSNHLPKSTRFQPPNWLVTSPRRERNKRIDLSVAAAPSLLAQLAGRRRISASTGSDGNALYCPDLALCEQPGCTAGCIKKENQTEPKAAVLIDLDGTLMDSTEQRERALAEALAVLDDPQKDISQRIEFFQQNVYGMGKLFQERGLSLGDFRKEWNHRGWYITYLVLSRDNNLLEQARLWAGLIENGEVLSEEQKGDKADWQGKFMKAYQLVQSESESMEAVAKAMAAFEQVRMYPFKEARDFLRSLQLTGSFSLYVVSEGHPDTQWSKLCNTGLADDFFNREHMLTTGDAVEPVKVRKDLQREREVLVVEAGKIKDSLKQIYNNLLPLNEIKMNLLIADSTSSAQNHTALIFAQKDKETAIEITQLNQKLALGEKRQKVADFVELVIWRMNRKELQFYASVMRAILRNPTSPRSMLVHFENIIKPFVPDKKIKFAMVGDRQKYDIEPPGKLLQNNIVTIRLNSLKYAHKEPVNGEYENPPMFVADTLAQVKAILLSKKTWQAISCASDPLIFNWDIEIASGRRDYFPDPEDDNDSRIGLDHIICGCEMPPKPFNTITRICAGILVEYFRQCDPSDIKKVMAPYLVGRLVEQARERVHFFRSVVCAGALHQGVLTATEQKDVAERISEDAELLKDDAEALFEIRSALEAFSKYGEDSAKKIADGILRRFNWVG